MTITARYPGRCARCGYAIHVGDRIEWDAGSRSAQHVKCPQIDPASVRQVPQRVALLRARRYQVGDEAELIVDRAERARWGEHLRVGDIVLVAPDPAKHVCNGARYIVRITGTGCVYRKRETLVADEDMWPHYPHAPETMEGLVVGTQVVEYRQMPCIIEGVIG